MNSYVNPYYHKAKEFYYICLEYHKKASPSQRIEDIMKSKKFPKNDIEFKDYLMSLINSYDRAIERIELEKDMNSLKLLGFNINNDLIQSFIIGIITGVYSLITNLLSNNSNPTTSNCVK
jgi:hypothetical protein